MIMTRSRNSSRAGFPVRRGASLVRRGASPVRRGGGDDDDSRPPSPLPRKSRGRMQTPSATAESDSPPRGRTMTRSSSRAASRRGPAVCLRLLLTMLLTISHLTQNIPTVSGHQVFLVVDTELRLLISLRRFLVVPVPSKTEVSNATMLGAASGSAAGRQVSIRVLEMVSRGGEVLLEVVQAVVKALFVPHRRLRANGIRQPAPTKSSRKP